MALIDIPAILGEAPHAFSGTREEKAEAQNMLKYLPPHGLEGLVTVHSVKK